MKQTELFREKQESEHKTPGSSSGNLNEIHSVAFFMAPVVWLASYRVSHVVSVTEGLAKVGFQLGLSRSGWVLGEAGMLLGGLRGHSVVLWPSSSDTDSPSGELTAAKKLRRGTTLNSSNRLSRLTLMEGISKLKKSAIGSCK